MKWSKNLAVGLLLVFTFSCTGGSDGLGVLQVPAVGETGAAYLDDGHPVFVVHDLDDNIYVVEAISQHIAEDTMGWCPSSRTIDDVFHGGRWDVAGRYFAGPGSSDLGTYQFDLAEDGRELTVTEYVDPAPRSTDSAGTAGPTCGEGQNAYEVHPYFDVG